MTFYAANVTGTEKLPLLILGQSPKPKYFKGVRSLQAVYKGNHKASMTRDIFEEWLRYLNQKMCANERKLLLISNNYTTHSFVNNQKSVEVQFLPHNVTLVFQTMDPVS